MPSKVLSLYYRVKLPVNVFTFYVRTENVDPFEAVKLPVKVRKRKTIYPSDSWNSISMVPFPAVCPKGSEQPHLNPSGSSNLGTHSLLKNPSKRGFSGRVLDKNYKRPVGVFFAT